MKREEGTQLRLDQFFTAAWKKIVLMTGVNKRQMQIGTGEQTAKQNRITTKLYVEMLNSFHPTGLIERSLFQGRRCLQLLANDSQDPRA